MFRIEWSGLNVQDFSNVQVYSKVFYRYDLSAYFVGLQSLQQIGHCGNLQPRQMHSAVLSCLCAQIHKYAIKWL